MSLITDALLGYAPTGLFELQANLKDSSGSHHDIAFADFTIPGPYAGKMALDLSTVGGAIPLPNSALITGNADRTILVGLKLPSSTSTIQIVMSWGASSGGADTKFGIEFFISGSSISLGTQSTDMLCSLPTRFLGQWCIFAATHKAGGNEELFGLVLGDSAATVLGTRSSRTLATSGINGFLNDWPSAADGTHYTFTGPMFLASILPVALTESQFNAAVDTILGTKSISLVTEVDSAVAQRRVRVYDILNGALLGETTTAVDGTGTIAVATAGAVMAICDDDYGQVWRASTASAAGARTFPTTPNSHWYKTTAGGTSGATEPAWPTNGGAVTDGTITWTDMGAMRAPQAQGPYVP
jgi:hypothetical protein